MFTEGEDRAFPVSDLSKTQALGLTKREYFASAAMQGYASRDGYGSFMELAIDAVCAADALINQLNKETPVTP